jgi:hypothetical protein
MTVHRSQQRRRFGKQWLHALEITRLARDLKFLVYSRHRDREICWALPQNPLIGCPPPKAADLFLAGVRLVIADHAMGPVGGNFFNVLNGLGDEIL